MSMKHAYLAGQLVHVDPGVFTASPTLATPTVECRVLETSPSTADQVYVTRLSNGDTLYVFKHRVAP